MSDNNSSGNKKCRCRNWTFVLYPESCPQNWKAVLDELNIEYVVSPLHDKDLNANNEPKKPHYHIMLMFGGVKAYEQVAEFTNALNGTVPQQVHNAKSLVRYMAHLDNPEKAQYDIKDIVCGGGVDVSSLLKPSAAERYTLIREMIVFCSEHNIVEFKDLMDYAMVSHFDDWFPLLCDNSAFVMQQYIKSQRHYGGAGVSVPADADAPSDEGSVFDE
jgi:hypothetical protein